jgi:hypothetical protein
VLITTAAGLIAATTVPAGAAPSPPLVLAQLMFRSRVVVRVQSVPTKAPVAITYKEKKGPRCLTMNNIVGAAVMPRTGIDLVLRGGERVRAQLVRACPGLDYYSGFYVLPPADGRLCADRDVVRDRAGGACEIERFRRLIPDK